MGIVELNKNKIRFSADRVPCVSNKRIKIIETDNPILTYSLKFIGLCGSELFTEEFLP